MYSLGGIHRNKSKDYQYTSYTCRRPKLSTGYAPFQSRFGITPAFAKDKTFKELPEDQKSYVICGVFYHSHENDEKWNRDEYGGWKTNGIRKNANTTASKNVLIQSRSDDITRFARHMSSELDHLVQIRDQSVISYSH